MIQFSHEKSLIAIVDDNVSNLLVLSTMLELTGYRVLKLQDSVSAAAEIAKASPDLIILDIMMPIKDGFEVCRELKAAEATAQIPVIFISAINKLEEVSRGFAVGGVDYVARPYQSEEVLARVQTHLSIGQLQRSLEQRVAELDLFNSTVAHDLRNPLSVVTSAAELLTRHRERLDEAKRAEVLHNIVSYSTKMTQIVDEMLLLAQVQRREIEAETLEMAQIVEQVLVRLKPMIESNTAVINLSGNNWPSALGQAGWIEEVWANLLSNAIKYGGEPPQVSLGAEAEGEFVKFWVKDNGAGLSAAARATLFQEFSRLNMKKEGYGLGLTIVKQIVEKLGGQVGIESEEGQGSTFYFTLPCA